jgi:hypothetical protein
MMVFFAITFMGIGAGQAAALAPDIGKAKPAMNSIFEVLEAKKISVFVCIYIRYIGKANPAMSVIYEVLVTNN